MGRQRSQILGYLLSAYGYEAKFWGTKPNFASYGCPGSQIALRVQTAAVCFCATGLAQHVTQDSSAAKATYLLGVLTKSRSRISLLLAENWPPLMRSGTVVASMRILL
eukprot:6184892-Pleurochrysis_carterae.AAC.1